MHPHFSQLLSLHLSLICGGRKGFESELLSFSIILSHCYTLTKQTIMGTNKNGYSPPGAESERRESISEAIDDEAIFDKGTLDPVYEAKARILNRAVCSFPGK